MGVGILLLFFAGVFYYWTEDSRKTAEHRKTTQAKYRESLTELQRDPTNAELKTRTLALGREYAKAMDARGDLRMGDEIAVSNDIAAACAGAFGPGRAATDDPAATRLSRLAALRDGGHVTQEEYQAERSRILSEI